MRRISAILLVSAVLLWQTATSEPGNEAVLAIPEVDISCDNAVAFGSLYGKFDIERASPSDVSFNQCGADPCQFIGETNLPCDNSDILFTCMRVCRHWHHEAYVCCSDVRKGKRMLAPNYYCTGSDIGATVGRRPMTEICQDRFYDRQLRTRSAISEMFPEFLYKSSTFTPAHIDCIASNEQCAFSFNLYRDVVFRSLIGSES